MLMNVRISSCLWWETNMFVVWYVCSNLWCCELFGCILLHKIALIASADCTAQPDTRPDEEKSVSVGPFNNLSPVCKLAFMCSVSCPRGSRFNFTDIVIVTATPRCCGNRSFLAGTLSNKTTSVVVIQPLWRQMVAWASLLGECLLVRESVDTPCCKIGRFYRLSIFMEDYKVII